MEQKKPHHSLAKRNSIETHWLTTGELRAQAHVIDTSMIKAAHLKPSDGHVDPKGVTQA